MRVYAGVFYPYCGIAVLGVHLYDAQQAQHIAHALLVYWQQHQQYPNQLSDAHIDAGTDFRRVFYRKSAEEMPICFIAQHLFRLTPIVTILLLNNPSNQHIESPCL